MRAQYRSRGSPNLLRLLTLAIIMAASSAMMLAATTQTGSQAGRQQALELFAQGKRLEALPLLEEQAKANPKDDEVLVALAACLVAHAATLNDPDVAAKERFRARDLLDQAWRLGNTSTLAQNLAHLLKELPESGALKFSDNPEVDRMMHLGEAAFARRDFTEALADYRKALELEPSNYAATLFISNSYDRENDVPHAGEWYEKAIRLDPNVETAYRYYADMEAKRGNMAKARTLLIDAAVAEPYNRIVWRELNAWATLNQTQINMVYVGRRVPDAAAAGAKDAKNSPPDFGPAWDAYQAVRDTWQHGDAFKKQYPQEAQYRHSLGEEYQALTAAAKTEEKLMQTAKNGPAVPEDPSMTLLLKLYHSGLIEAYVLFSLGDEGIARDYPAYRAKNREKLEEYMDRFVVPKL